jgi:hypothetical protein
MKKIIAVVLTVLMIIPLGIVFSSAEATNIASGKTYEFTGAYTDGTGKLWYPDTDNKELTDGIKSINMSDIGYSEATLPLWVGINTTESVQTRRTLLTILSLTLEKKRQILHHLFFIQRKLRDLAL